jgi:RIO-like serine/threonine protein kinase
MEYIDGITLGKSEIKTNNNIYANLRDAIKLLHNENLVFADLRTPNILVVDINGCQQAKLIDFDWCGVHNKDRYPPSMNSDITWPTGASPHALLQKDHDLHWLNELRKFLRS